MKIRKVEKQEYPVLVEIWERSVRATHQFLQEEELLDIKSKLAVSYFPKVELYAAASDGDIVGFLGLSEDMIEMLFIDAEYIGKGFGSKLIDIAIKRGISKVDVNEQNPKAMEFYKAKGFHAVGRDEVDGEGRPYPIIHMTL